MGLLTFPGRGFPSGYSILLHFVSKVFMLVSEQAHSPEPQEEGVIDGEGRVPRGEVWLVAKPGEQVNHLVVPTHTHMYIHTHTCTYTHTQVEVHIY